MKPTKQQFIFETAIGPMIIEIDNGKLQSLHLMAVGDGFVEDEVDDALAKEAIRQVKAYFDGSLKQFDLPLNFETLTPFTRKVYEALIQIPYAETTTYQELAILAGSPGASRAVGGAVARNRLFIIVPCHRVLGSDGKLHGFSAPGGLETKAWLLNHEKKHAGKV